MPPQLLLRARLHRNAYYPGSSLKFELTLLAAESGAAAGDMRCYDDAGLAELFRAAAAAPPAGRPAPAAAAAGEGVRLFAVAAQLYGVCSADSTWINDINEFADPLAGAAPERPPPAPDSGGGWLQWLAGGGSGGEAAGAPQLLARSGHPLPTPEYSGRHGNYHFVFRTEVSELLPGVDGLAVGEARRVVGEVELPPALPPSYSGYSMRYSYHVWCCARWQAGDGPVRDAAVRVPLRVWNPAASLHPIRPPFAPPLWDYRWRAREVSLADEPRRPHPGVLTHNPRSRSLSPTPGGEGLGTPAELVPYPSEDFSRSPMLPKGSSPAGQGHHGSPSPRRDSPSSELGDLLRDDDVGADGDADAAAAFADAPPPAAAPFVDVFAAVEQLLSAKAPLRETPVCSAGSSKPFCFVFTHQQHICIGDAITGVVQAAEDPGVLFVRVSVRLEYEEKVPAELFKSGTHVPSPRRACHSALEGDAPGKGFSRCRATQTVVVEEFDEVMFDCAETSFEFVLAPHHPTTIYTDKVAVEWFLRFEFDCAPLSADPVADGRLTCMEPILWQLPLQVHVPPAENRSRKAGPCVYAG
eukprot:TRINITY_DN297_c2_g2_i1.p1 TRINITY_DN297_c2_g2~~TRINITY_DN297_c2_g2_i1.p1  ORF type:complete len:582 (+),score=206.91 TRINITY_DN297_c2_g2_i1:108-1853(+)